MKKIEFSGRSVGRFFYVSDEQYDEFSKYTWYLDAKGYPSTTIKAHQLSMGKFRRDGKSIIDHIDGNPLNNSIENLRIVTPAQNMMNKKLDKRNKVGYKGVVKRTGNRINPYIVQIGNKLDGIRQKYLGAFPTAEAAAKAYDDEAKKKYGKYARLNFPEES